MVQRMKHSLKKCVDINRIYIVICNVFFLVKTKQIFKIPFFSVATVVRTIRRKRMI